jgi:phosphonate transport system substrate-binding protein
MRYLAFVFACTLLAAAHAADTKTLAFGVLPAVDAARMQKDFAPLAEEMSKAVGRPVEVIVPDDYADMLHKIIYGEVNVALLSPYIYVGVKSDVQKDVLVQRRMSDAKSFRAVCVVKDGTSGKTIAELKGKRVAYVDRGSSSGHLYPRIEMRKQGIDPEKHFSEVSFAGSHEAVLAALAKNSADVGCLSERSFAAQKGYRVLLRSDPVADDVIIARKGVSDSERQALKRMFLDAAKSPAMKAFMDVQGIAAFVEPDVSVYAAVEQEIQR